MGAGPHARPPHLPTLGAGRSADLVGATTGVDVADAAGDITAFDSAAGTTGLPVTFTEPFDASS